MCGIGGWLGAMEDAAHHARAMAVSMHHRGPDAKGWQVWDCGGLAHARLSIIDLSDDATEPLPNEEGTIWTVFNGEIYNPTKL